MSVDEPIEPQIIMSPETVAAIKKRGGSVYVWADKAGLAHASAKPPRDPSSFETFSRDDCSIHVDRGIEPAGRWMIKWARWPRPHFQAFYNPATTEIFFDLPQQTPDF